MKWHIFIAFCSAVYGSELWSGGLAILFDEEAEGVDDASEKRAQ